MRRKIKINYPHFAVATIKITFLQKYSTSSQTNIEARSALHNSIAIRINFVFLFMKNEPVIAEIQLYRTIL